MITTLADQLSVIAVSIMFGLFLAWMVFVVYMNKGKTWNQKDQP